jgi:hypothetical protein
MLVVGEHSLKMLPQLVLLLVRQQVYQLLVLLLAQ